MAKTFSDGILPVSFLADADLSAKQYYAVKPASTADYVTTANGASDPYPIGLVQSDDADTIGDAVDVKVYGFSKAVVAACTTGGAACDIDFGHRLQAGSDAKLYYASCGVANAIAVDFLASGSAILNVFWLGPASVCAYSAS